MFVLISDAKEIIQKNLSSLARSAHSTMLLPCRCCCCSENYSSPNEFSVNVNLQISFIFWVDNEYEYFPINSLVCGQHQKAWGKFNQNLSSYVSSVKFLVYINCGGKCSVKHLQDAFSASDNLTMELNWLSKWISNVDIMPSYRKQFRKKRLFF